MEEFTGANPAVELVDEGKVVGEVIRNNPSNLTTSSWLVDSPHRLLRGNLPGHPHHPRHPLRHLLQTETEKEIQLWCEEIQKHGIEFVDKTYLSVLVSPWYHRQFIQSYFKSQLCGRSIATTSTYSQLHNNLVFPFYEVSLGLKLSNSSSQAPDNTLYIYE